MAPSSIVSPSRTEVTVPVRVPGGQPAPAGKGPNKTTGANRTRAAMSSNVAARGAVGERQPVLNGVDIAA
jgi:hypothetical protein